MVRHRWEGLNQERVVVGDAHRVRYGGFGMWHGASNGESHRWEDRRGQCREHSVWGKMQMKLRYRGAGCGDPGGTGDGAVSRGRDRVVVHGGQMMGHRWWAQIVQEGWGVHTGCDMGGSGCGMGLQMVRHR